MAGTVEGGLAAAVTNKSKYGADFYAEIGRRGGKAHHSVPRGFAQLKISDPTKLSDAGRKGGTISRRTRRYA